MHTWFKILRYVAADAGILSRASSISGLDYLVQETRADQVRRGCPVCRFHEPARRCAGSSSWYGRLDSLIHAV